MNVNDIVTDGTVEYQVKEFVNNSDLNNAVITLNQSVNTIQTNLNQMEQNVNTVINNNISQIEQNITNIQDAIPSVYVPKGSVAFASLPATPDETMLGWTYNVYEDFTTDNRFLEGSGKKYYSGENVVIIETVPKSYTLTSDTTAVEGKTYYSDSEGTLLDPQPETGSAISNLYEEVPGTYKYDVLSGYVDLSQYVKISSWDASTATLALTTN